MRQIGRMFGRDAAAGAGEEQPWRRTILGLSAALILSMAGMGFVQPFIPLYVQDLGVTDAVGIRMWAGGLAAAGALAFAVSAPLWGLVADRVGRKPMVVRAMLLGGIASVGMAFVGSATELAVVRVLQGLVSGSGLASFALASGIVPRDRLLRAMGLMQVAMLAGQMIGPSIGGVVADVFGIRSALIVGGSVQAAGALIVWVAVKEQFRRVVPAPGADMVPAPVSLVQVVRHPAFVACVGGAGGLAFLSQGTQPFMALYVQQLGAGDLVLTVTGLLQGGFSLAAGAGSYAASRLVGQFGLQRTILAGLVGSAIALVPMGLVPSFGALVIARVVQGAFIGVSGPSLQALVSQSAPAERRGTMFGLFGATTGLGAATGPLMAGGVAATAGLSVALLTAAGIGSAGTAWFAVRLRAWRRDLI